MSKSSSSYDSEQESSSFEESLSDGENSYSDTESSFSGEADDYPVIWVPTPWVENHTPAVKINDLLLKNGEHVGRLNLPLLKTLIESSPNFFEQPFEYITRVNITLSQIAGPSSHHIRIRTVLNSPKHITSDAAGTFFSETTPEEEREAARVSNLLTKHGFVPQELDLPEFRNAFPLCFALWRNIDLEREIYTDPAHDAASKKQEIFNENRPDAIMRLAALPEFLKHHPIERIYDFSDCVEEFSSLFSGILKEVRAEEPEVPFAYLLANNVKLKAFLEKYEMAFTGLCIRDIPFFFDKEKSDAIIQKLPLRLEYLLSLPENQAAQERAMIAVLSGGVVVKEEDGNDRTVSLPNEIAAYMAALDPLAAQRAVPVNRAAAGLGPHTEAILKERSSGQEEKQQGNVPRI